MFLSAVVFSPSKGAPPTAPHPCSIASVRVLPHPPRKLPSALAPNRSSQSRPDQANALERHPQRCFSAKAKRNSRRKETAPLVWSSPWVPFLSLKQCACNLLCSQSLGPGRAMTAQRERPETNKTKTDLGGQMQQQQSLRSDLSHLDETSQPPKNDVPPMDLP